MSFGKMNTTIDICTMAPIKDSEGFITLANTVLTRVFAYKEDRHGNEKWANQTSFANASALFRFRVIPGVPIDTSLLITCGEERYRIISAEDVRGRGMYIEVLAEKLEPTVR